MSLYDFISSSKGEILRRARAKVSARQFPTVSREELESGLPLFLTQLAETLRLRSSAEPFSPTAIGTSAGEHGVDLQERGWTVAQVVHDYGDICQAITEAAVEKALQITAEDFQILNLCLDNAIAGAVTEFSRERDEQNLGEGEAERLGQLTHELRNLLSTAMLSYEALQSGRVQNALKFSVPHGHVAVRTAANDGTITIEVEDECGGLPDKNAESLFSPFGQRRGKSRSGRGLGLSISRKAVKVLGGDIRVRNLAGKGCVFIIDLPAGAHEEKAEASESVTEHERVVAVRAAPGATDPH
jgi:hypothetical protein